MDVRDGPIQSGRPLTMRVLPFLLHSNPKFKTSPTGILAKTRWGRNGRA